MTLRILVAQLFVLHSKARLHQALKALRLACHQILPKDQWIGFKNLFKPSRLLLASRSRPIWRLLPTKLGIPPQKTNSRLRAWFRVIRLIVPISWVLSALSLLYIHTLRNLLSSSTDSNFQLLRTGSLFPAVQRRSAAGPNLA